MQEGHAINYESNKLNEHEKLYVTHDIQLTTIMYPLKMWRCYLLGRKFILMLNHSGLRYLFDYPRLNSKQASWMTLISEFHFEIWYI